MKNIFESIPNSLNEELFSTILDKKNLKIERIVSQGQASPTDFWYDQKNHEWVLLLEGEAEIEFQDKKVKLGKGDFLEIPAHKRHRVSYTSTRPKAVWLAIHWD